MTLDGFSALPFVPSVLKVLAEKKKKKFYSVFCRLILQLELPHNDIYNKVYYDLAITSYYFFK